MSATARFDFRAPVPDVAELGRVHLVAIGGIGMSAVARLLLAHGVAVSGSDARDSPVLADLREAGARVWAGHDARHVEGADTVVVSSAVREDNVELAAARAAGLRVLHRSQALAATAAGERRVAVAGANGKTTTTSMLAVALDAAGADPSFAAGGEIAALGTNARRGTGGVFVVEADESDGSFLVYRPHVSVVTNVQADHLDHFGDLEGVRAAYREFVATMPEGGLLVACADDPGSADLAASARAEGVDVCTYGLAGNADVRLTDPVGQGLGSTAVLTGPDGVARSLRLAVPGRHNQLDAAAAWTAAVLGLGADPEDVLAGLAGFTGARRRFEVRGRVRGVTVVDDYAHNPGKVDAVVRTGAGIAAGHRLVVVFQPHLYSRTRDFAAEFAAALAPADEVVLLDVYGAREDPVPGVGPELVAGPLRAAGTSVMVCHDHAEVPGLVAGLCGPGDLVLTVGAGDVTALAPQVVRALEET